jgi:hypothetical protein
LSTVSAQRNANRLLYESTGLSGDCRSQTRNGEHDAIYDADDPEGV